MLYCFLFPLYTLVVSRPPEQLIDSAWCCLDFPFELLLSLSTDTTEPYCRSRA
jgi:hypothetical protein